MRPRRFPFALFLLPALAALPGWAQPAVEVADLNVRTPFTVAAPDAGDTVALSGGRLFFVQGSSFDGEPAVTDGRRTEQLADLCPGPCGAQIEVLGRLGGLVLFTAATPGNRHQLYRSDGTRAGTFALGAEAAASPQGIAGNRLFFVRDCSLQSACALWQSDGSPAGTSPVPGAPGLTAAAGAPIVAAGRRVFFLAGTAGSDLWVSDGTAAGTARVQSLRSAPRLLTGAASRLYFLATVADGSEQLWTSDGTPSGTRPLSAFAQGALAATRFLATAGDRAYLVADDAASGAEIWSTDATPAGTRRVTDFGYFAPFDQVTSPDRLQEIPGHLIFPASDGLHGLRPWATNGTPGSTVLLASVRLDPASAFVRVGARVVFSVVGDGGDEIWSTDGTPAGTRRLALSCPGSCDPSRLAVFPLLGAAFFVGDDRAHGPELWSTDGTPGGTRRFGDGLPDDAPLSLDRLAASGGRLFFLLKSHPESLVGTLWTSDGTPGGTRPAPPDTTTSGAGSEPRELTAFDGRLFFTACDGTARQLFQSDGTAAGTAVRVALSASPTGCQDDRLQGLAATTGSGGSGGSLFFWRRDDAPAFPQPYTLFRLDAGGEPQPVATVPFPFAPGAPVPLGARVFFVVGTATGTSAVVWKSDGTAAGTHPDPDLPPFARVLDLALGPGRLYVSGVSDDAPGRVQIWSTDGTAAGTARLVDVAYDGSFYRSVGAGSASLLLTQLDPSTIRLWRTDGTAAGTVALRDFPSHRFTGASEPTLLDGQLYFFAGTPNGRGLWRSDGTAAGTVLLHELPPSDAGLAQPAQLTPFLGRLFFAADDGVHGRELWATDGTPAGTALFTEIEPGPYGAAIDHLTVASGRLFFTAYDPLHGDELWQSDGTLAGTRPAADLAPESDSSYPDRLTVVSGRLFFTADDGLSGRELWTVPAAAGCTAGETRLCLTGGRFAVEIAWKDFQGGSGAGHAVALTEDTGYFWFFAASNVEVVVKVLDARALNQAFWVFYGALSTVEYTITVTDTQTGLTRRYVNPSGQLASAGDTDGFGPLGAFDSKALSAPAKGSSPLGGGGWERGEARRGVAATGSCAAGPGTLCLQGNRFAVSAAWKDFSGHTGTGTAVPLTGDTGYFWFFNSSNVEVVTKVLDGRGLNGEFWLFYGALSNVEYTLTVTDTQTGAVKTYKNPSGQFGSVGDTGAFP